MCVPNKMPNVRLSQMSVLQKFSIFNHLLTDDIFPTKGKSFPTEFLTKGKKGEKNTIRKWLKYVTKAGVMACSSMSTKICLAVFVHLLTVSPLCRLLHTY